MSLYLTSMNDLTKTERAEAAAQNWGLFHVYDLAKQRWSMNVLPLSFGPGIDADKALKFVMDRARSNQPLALKALQLLSAFNAGQARKEKKK